MSASCMIHWNLRGINLRIFASSNTSGGRRRDKNGFNSFSHITEQGKKWARFLAFDVIIRFDCTGSFQARAQDSAGLNPAFYYYFIYISLGWGVNAKKFHERVSRSSYESVTSVLCLLTECTMSEGGRAVIWLLVSALRAARHPEDSRTNRPLSWAPSVVCVCRKPPTGWRV